MVFLQPSSTESAFVFSTDDGSDAIVLDIKGVYALVDGGAESSGFIQCLRTPTAAIVSTASPSSLTNAIELNKGADSLVAVVANLPSSAAIKDAAAAEPIRELYKTLSVPPIVSQLKGAKPEPIVIHKGVSSGTLSVYTLAGDAKDAEAVAKAYQSGSLESIETASSASSSVLLIVWEPARSDAPIKRILHLGTAPLPRIQQALDRARTLPFLQSAAATGASLKAKPAPASASSGRQASAAAPSSARPSARVAPAHAAAPPASAKPAARVAPATRPTARPAAAAAPTARAAAAAPRPTSMTRASLPTRAVAATAARPTAAASSSSSAARPARASTASKPTAHTAPSRAAASRGGAVKEEVAKKTMVGKSAAAPSSSVRSSAHSTPNGAASRTPAKAAPAPSSTTASPAGKKGGASTTAATTAAAATATAAVAAVAVTAVAAASDVDAVDASSPLSQPTVVEQHQREEEHHEEEEEHTVAAPAITVSIEEGGEEEVSTPGGLPVPASPTIIPATPQPPMSPEPEEVEEKEPARSPSPPVSPTVAAAVDPVEDEHHEEKREDNEEKTDMDHHHPLYPTLPLLPSAPVEEEEESAAVPPPSAPSLESAASVDEPECVKELVEEDPTPTPLEPEVVAVPEPHDEPTPTDPTEPHDEKEEEEEEPHQPVEPEPTIDPIVVPGPAPVDPSPVGDLLGDFDEPVQPQQPGDDGLLDSLEEPMKKMQISMDTDKLAEELGLVGLGDESLLDLTQSSTADTDLNKTQNSSVIESAHEFDDLLSPTKESAEEMQRKLSTQAEENLLTAAADPFIAGLVSHVVETATIDGAKQSQTTLESLMNNSRGMESPTGDKLLSFRSSGFENPDEPKEVKYEESDPAIDDVLTKLADESDMVNGGDNHVELNGHGDGHHVVNGNGWPEGTTMHLPPPTTKGSGKEAKFKLAGPVHVDLVTVPHRGKQILLNDEAASIEFFSSVRSSIYILQSGGDVPVHVLEGWKKGKSAWALNVPSRLVPTHHNDTIARWMSDNYEELAEIGLTVATPVELTTLTYPDGQAKACTLVL